VVIRYAALSWPRREPAPSFPIPAATVGVAVRLNFDVVFAMMCGARFDPLRPVFTCFAHFGPELISVHVLDALAAGIVEMCLVSLVRLGCVWDVDLSWATGPAAAEEPLDALFEADQTLLAAGEQIADAATEPPRRFGQADRPALDAPASLQEKS